jgi:signal transduction histidine kinase
MDEVQRLTKIVDGLTFLTKADSGQVALAREKVDLDELVTDSFEDSKILAKSKGIDVQLIECQKLAVLGDRHRLRQLLLNLTDNSIKYNFPNGKVTLALRANQDFAEIEIANTGHGIPLEMQSRVFDRFFRCDESHNHEVDGCGLGLSIAQWIVRAHGGTIQITSSQPKDWTHLLVRIPLLKSNVSSPSQ